MCESQVVTAGERCATFVSSFAVKHECKCSVCKTMPMVGFRSALVFCGCACVFPFPYRTKLGKIQSFHLCHGC